MSSSEFLAHDDCVSPDTHTVIICLVWAPCARQLNHFYHLDALVIKLQEHFVLFCFALSLKDTHVYQFLFIWPLYTGRILFPPAPPTLENGGVQLNYQGPCNRDRRMKNQKGQHQN